MSLRDKSTVEASHDGAYYYPRCETSERPSYYRRKRWSFHQAHGDDSKSSSSSLGHWTDSSTSLHAQWRAISLPKWCLRSTNQNTDRNPGPFSATTPKRRNQHRIFRSLPKKRTSTGSLHDGNGEPLASPTLRGSGYVLAVPFSNQIFDLVRKRTDGEKALRSRGNPVCS